MAIRTVQQIIEAMNEDMRMSRDHILRQWAEEIAEEMYNKIQEAEWPYMISERPLGDIKEQL